MRERSQDTHREANNMNDNMTTSVIFILVAQGSVLSQELPYSTSLALDFLTFASSLIFLLCEVKNSLPLKTSFLRTYWLLWSECLHPLKTRHVEILTPKDDGIRKWGLQELLES